MKITVLIENTGKKPAPRAYTNNRKPHSTGSIRSLKKPLFPDAHSLHHTKHLVDIVCITGEP